MGEGRIEFPFPRLRGKGKGWGLGEGRLELPFPRRTGEGKGMGAHGAVTLGVALPKSGRCSRIAFRVPMGAVREFQPPLALREVIVSAPAAWQAELAALDQALASFSPRVYGSVAWQCLTGEAYLTAESDIDLLLAPKSLAELEATLEALTAFQPRTVLKLDGEVLLPGGGAVAWRELARRPRTVLVKSLRAVELVPIERAFAQYASEVAA